LAGAVVGKLRTCVGAGGAYVEYGADLILEAVFFGYVYKGLQIYIDIFLILRDGVVNKYIYLRYAGQSVIIAYVNLVMGIVGVADAGLLPVYPQDQMALSQELFVYSLSNTLGGA